MSLQTVIFDMDGVIVDTEPLHRKAWFNTYEDFGMEVSDSVYESFTGQSTLNVANQLIAQFGVDTTTEKLISTKRRYFKNLFDTDPEFDLINGVRNLVEELYKENICLILASSASMNTINWVFERFGLNPYFKAKISGAELKESKPHPEIFQKAVELSGFSAKNCIVIEDSTNGVIAAKKAGIFTIGYNSEHSKNQDYSLADIVISDFKEINYKEMNSFVSLQQ